MNKIIVASTFVTCLTLFGCKGSATDHKVVLVDRTGALSVSEESDPLRLMVEIDEAGRLRLNKIETGTMTDLNELTEKLKVIFADRRMASVDRREVVIYPHGDVQREDLERLIRRLDEANASPIRMITGSAGQN